VTQNASCYLLTTNIWFGTQKSSQIAIMLFASFSTGYLFYGVDISSGAKLPAACQFGLDYEAHKRRGYTSILQQGFSFAYNHVKIQKNH
jgi:hypothetical protein